MSRRTSEASKAVKEAWEKERQLVLEGKGTRDWTLEQQQAIIERGKAYDENGKAFEGHHMKSAEAYPEYQGDPANIEFLARAEHKDAHGGCFQNPTNGYYDPKTRSTRDFGENKYGPCKVIALREPIKVPTSAAKIGSKSTGRTGSRYLPSSAPGADARSASSSYDDTGPVDSAKRGKPFAERYYPSERSSPRKHQVSGYTRHQNGKTIHVDPYDRGGQSPY